MGDCLPMVLSEAGAVGLPLVSTDVGAIGEIVRDGETGLLVPVDDAGALAAALHRLADDPDARRRMGEAARQLVREQFDAGANARTPRRPAARHRRRPPAGGSARMSAPTLLTVSGTHPRRPRGPQIAAGRRPRTDYVEMAASFDAELLDRSGAMGAAGPLAPAARPARRQPAAGVGVLPAPQGAPVVFTDGEQVGIPYAAMTRLVRRRPRHVMIGHVLSPRKKSLLHRVLRLQHRVDALVVYATEQARFAVDAARVPARPGRAVPLHGRHRLLAPRRGHAGTDRRAR